MTILKPIKNLVVFSILLFVANAQILLFAANAPGAETPGAETGGMLELRKELGLKIGGGKGVLIAPRWVLTASHVITSKKQLNKTVVVKFQGDKSSYSVKIKVDKVIRYKFADLALLHLTESAVEKGFKPVVLLETTLTKKDGVFTIKKQAGKKIYVFSARARYTKRIRRVPGSGSAGPAGSSGSGWSIYSKEHGMVLVGITHGGGYSPKLSNPRCKKWIISNVGDGVKWISKDEAFPNGLPRAAKN